MAGIAFKSALYNCATNCALRRLDRKCKNTFGSKACVDCRLNINNYINADPRHSELFMMEAEQRAYSLKPDLFKPIFALVLIGGLIAACGFAMCSNAHRVRKLSVQPTATVMAQHEDITSTMQKVAYDLKVKNVDVNKDGLQNCIDAAVLFYQYFPDKSRVCIERNYNTTTDMNHLFNCVKIDGVWKAIEPQTLWRGHKSFWMRDVWGNILRC